MQMEEKKVQREVIEEEDGGEDSDNSDQEDMGADKFKKYINGAARMFVQFEKAYYGDNYDGKSKIKIDLFKEKKKVVKPVMQQACLRTPSEPKNISVAIQRKVDATDRTDRSYKKIEAKSSNQPLTLNRGKRSKSKQKLEKDSNVKDAEGASDQTGRKSQNPMMSLPRISVINYLAYEDEKMSKEGGSVFRKPKIENIYMRNSFKRYG